MIDIKLDPITNDLVIEDYDFSLVESHQQISQNLSIRLKFFLGEWFLDIFEGVPYYQEIFVKNPNLILIENSIKEEIITTRGVQEIISFSSRYDRQKRLYSIVFSVLLIDGEEIQKEMEMIV